MDFEMGIYRADDASFRPVPREQLGTLQEVKVENLLGQGMLKVPASQARSLAQKNYRAVKADLIAEALENGIDLKRLAFDDAASTIELNHGLYELITAFPKTSAKHLGRLAENPDELVHAKPFWLQHVENRTSGFSFKQESLKRMARVLEMWASRPRPKLDFQSGSVALLLEKVYQKSEGLVIGEDHLNAAPRRFLIDNMPKLKSLGVTTLYMEHLTQTLQKDVLDKYHKAPAGSPMPRELELFLARIDANHASAAHMLQTEPHRGHVSLTAVVKAAQNHGVRIVAIDTDASYAENSAGSRMRILAMNYVAGLTIAQHIGGKWLALVGSAHMNNSEERRGNKTVSTPGVAELTGAVAIAMDSGDNIQNATMERDVRNNDDALATTFDHFLKLPTHFDAATAISTKA